MKTTSLTDLVDFVIAYGNIHGFNITPLKLQKILYYIQSWHIAKFDKHTLFDVLPQAWVNGPVYRPVYDKFKANFFKDDVLVSPFVREDGENALEKIKVKLNVTEDQMGLINTVTKHYASMWGTKLVMLTHADAPWNEAREGYGELARCENYITVDSMYRFYNPRIQS